MLCSSVVTRTADELAATRLEYDANGRIAAQTGAAREVGTTIELRNLFHSLPVRLQEVRGFFLVSVSRRLIGRRSFTAR